MACNAYNHPHDCNCGWGGYGQKGRKSDQLYNYFFKTNENFINPNAQCPICGSRVFYFEDKNGGKVYFDSLGPPWPKHPCTSTNRQMTKNNINKKEISCFSWQENKWIPAICTSIKFNSGYDFIELKLLDLDAYAYFVADYNIYKTFYAGLPVHIREVVKSKSIYQISTFDKYFNPIRYFVTLSEDMNPYDDSIKSFTLMENYLNNNMQISNDYYLLLSKENDLSLENYIYIFFRFFDDKEIIENLLSNSRIIENKLADFFKNIMKYKTIESFFERVESKKISIPSSIINIIRRTKNVPILEKYIDFLDKKRDFIIKKKKNNNIKKTSSKNQPLNNRTKETKTNKQIKTYNPKNRTGLRIIRKKKDS